MKIGRKSLWFLLTAIALLVLVPAGQATAQQDSFQLSLNVLPGYYYWEITPGQETTIYLEISNTGSQAVTDIKLTTVTPDNLEGWTIGLNPKSIASLGAGSSQTIDVTLTAPPGTARGDYTLTFIAEAGQTRTVTSTTVNVVNSLSVWLWVGVGLAVLLIAAFVIIFLRFGRD
jgi:uncharacterized membrane protein